MKISILHISDLHRDSANPIRNDVLLDSLENDRRHYSTEETTLIRSPDLIIVSGDIIQGIKSDTTNPEANLQSQYREALQFLSALTDRFVKGNRDHIIIVPGNHDISAYHFERSLCRIDIPEDRKKELASQLFSPGSQMRWSWSQFKLYEIADKNLYAQRLAAFAEFYATFYKGTRAYDLDPVKQIEIFDYPEFELTIAGFSSCYNNDLLNKQGAIHPGCIANAGEILRKPTLQNRLRIAVWHHNTEGLPEHSDYMDPDILQNLIDRGFSLGFHGHQHRPKFLETRFQHGTDRKIKIISAGTLCGNASFRYGRAYNIIELDTDNRNACLHVREMKNDNLPLPIWGCRVLPQTTNPYYEFNYDPPPEPSVGSNANTAALKEVQNFYDTKEYRKASDILIHVMAEDALAKPLLLDCLVKLKDMSAIIVNFDPPTSNAEAIHLMDALWQEGKRDRLREVLELPELAGAVDPSVKVIREKYKVRLNI